MKAPIPRHEKRGAQSMIWVVCLLCVLVSAMSLGSMRLYGLYLEHRLAYITTKIDSIGNRNAALEERYSSLLSPSRIYNYAKSELKMITAREIEVIRLDSPEAAVDAGMSMASAGQPTRESIRAPGLSAVFAQTAHAKD